MSRARLVLAAMSLPLLALSIDVSGAGVLLPAIGKDLHLGAGGLAWVMNASALAFGATLVAVGRVADRLGPRRLLLGGIVAFGAASLLCGLAPVATVLIVGRLAQGLASSLVFTTSLTVIDTLFDDAHRPGAIGIWGAVGGAGSALGPLVAGLLAAGASWRWFFMINVPLCLVAVPIVAALVPADRPSAEREPLSWGRLSVLAVGFVALSVAAGRAASSGWSSPGVVVGAAVTAGALAVLVAVRRRGGPALFSPAVTASRWFGPGLVIAFCSNWGFGVTIVVMSEYLQQVRGQSAALAGVVTLAFSATFAAAGLVTGLLVRRLGMAVTLAAAMVLCAGAFALRIGLDAATGIVLVVAGLGVGGLGQGLAFDASTAASLEDVPTAAAGAATGIIQSVRLLGLVLGVAVSASLGSGRHLASGVRAAMALSLVLAVVAIAGVRLRAGWAVASGR